ncbi:MAG: GerAB/ArcD/ProY family transporter [Lachnospiraceae bacterium]|nr:GerAB/ArcD/ProY family transporter [Lachnospiraceae bacterium]
MILDNGKISERQCFRLGLLENITLGIVVVPYICVSSAGRWHYIAFAIGLLLTFLYSMIIYFFSKAFPHGMIEEMDGLLGKPGRLIDVIYTLRYVIRASLIILFFAVILREYMLRSFNLWVIIISFIMICGYGGARDIEKRGRLIELLFWWMIVPLILVAVFSVSNVNWELKSVEENANYAGIWSGSYRMLILMSSVETFLFTLTKVKKNSWSNYLKTIIWIMISVLFSYIFVQGVIGEKWVGSSSMSALYVMEAAKFPGGVERLDYAVIAFWIIGVFSVASGYMFYAKEFLRVAFSKRWNSFEKNEKGELSNNSIEIVSDKWWTMALVMLLTGLFVWLWSLYDTSTYLLDYLIWFDVALSIFIPLFVLCVKWNKKTRLKEKYVVTGSAIKPDESGERDNPIGVIIGRRVIRMLIVLVGCSFFLYGCNKRVDFNRLDDRQSSLESMDYAVRLSVREMKEKSLEDRFLFDFEIADLSDYKGDSEELLSTDDYECMASTLDAALDSYYEAKENHVDLGHLKMIRFYSEDDRMKDIVFELKNMPSVTKSVDVEVFYKNGKEKITLRNLIKRMYDGEEF